MRVETSISLVTLLIMIPMLLALAVAILDLVRGTDYSIKLGFAPASVPVIVIGLLLIPYLSAAGNSISEFWGDVLPLGCMIFIISGVLITNRSRRTPKTARLN